MLWTDAPVSSWPAPACEATCARAHVLCASGGRCVADLAFGLLLCARPDAFAVMRIRKLNTVVCVCVCVWRCVSSLCRQKIKRDKYLLLSSRSVIKILENKIMRDSSIPSEDHISNLN